MRDYPCDNLPCMNRIPEDEYRRVLDKWKEEGLTPGLIFCGHCEDSPPPSEIVKYICEAPIEEIIDILQEVSRGASEEK